jgi:hypothetical protein
MRCGQPNILEEMMKVIAVFVLLLGLAAFTACNKGGNAAGAVVTKADSAQVAASAPADGVADQAEGEDHKESEEHKQVTLPASVQLASGASIPVVGVVKLDENPTAHKGQVAVMGLVETVLPDKHAFTLCDCTAEVGCKDGCCPAVKFPVNVPDDKFEGKLPEVSQQVTVIGTLTPGKTGYSFEIAEVRVGDATTITRKDATKTT